MVIRFGLFIVLAAVAGCARQAPQQAVGVRTIDPAGYKELLRQHRGRVVLVDFWATWCQPCQELFPHGVELSRRLAGRGLSVVSLSLDDPDNQQAVERFLQRQDVATAGMENFISRDGFNPQAAEDYQITGGAIPHLKLYDRQGKLRQTFPDGDGHLDPRQIERAVEELLDEKS
jgi:thiol-disulfide isomerase/thioredoxin